MLLQTYRLIGALLFIGGCLLGGIVGFLGGLRRAKKSRGGEYRKVGDGEEECGEDCQGSDEEEGGEEATRFSESLEIT